jgi:hypothetical protein
MDLGIDAHEQRDAEVGENAVIQGIVEHLVGQGNNEVVFGGNGGLDPSRLGSIEQFASARGQSPAYPLAIQPAQKIDLFEVILQLDGVLFGPDEGFFLLLFFVHARGLRIGQTSFDGAIARSPSKGLQIHRNEGLA